MISKETLSDQQIIENIKKEGLPLIIFGAGIVGEVLLKACCNAGIMVEGFCDNNINKARFPLCNIEVGHTSSLRTRYKDASFLISAADIKDVVDQLHKLGYSKWYPSNILLADFDICQYQFSAPTDFVEYAVNTALLSHDSYLNPDKLFMRSVDLIITERCSLKCKDCSNLMQYYKTPINCNIQELMQTFGRS